MLLNLAFNYTREDNSHYKGKLRIWKTGLYWCTSDEIEVSVEFCDGNKLCLIMHSSSNQDNALYDFTKYKCEIIREIRRIRNNTFLQENTEQEYMYFPAKNLMQNRSKFKLRELSDCFKKEIKERTLPYQQVKVIHIEKILLFDPFICLDFALLVKLKNQNILAIDEIPEKLRHFLRYLKMEPKELSISVLQGYSIFNLQHITSL